MPRSHQGVLCSAGTWYLSFYHKASCTGYYCPQDYPLPMQTRKPHTKDKSTVREGPTATDPSQSIAGFISKGGEGSFLSQCSKLLPGLCHRAAHIHSLHQVPEKPLLQPLPRLFPLSTPRSPEDVILCLPLSSALFQYTQSQHSSHFSGAPRPLIEQCRQISNDMPWVQIVKLHVLTWTKL